MATSVAVIHRTGFVKRGAAWLLAVIVGDVLRVRRAHVESAMERANVANPRETARAMYRSLGRGLVELLGMAFSHPRRRLSARFPWSAIEALAAEPNGAVIATAHTGSWDLVACAVATRAPLTVITKRLSIGVLDGVWQRLRRARGVRLVEVGAAARSTSAALANRELVAMLVDQAPERSRGAIRIPFLGALAWVDLAPALCAMRSRAPLVVAFPRRLADGLHTVEIAAVLRPPLTPRRRWAIDAMTEATRMLEAFVLEHPEQWLWMHRRWKDTPASTAAVPAGQLAGAPP
ncbi:MAG TPA: lysophospholipid acyltransferase family protein [Polyangiaceae bacterium]|jgi:KDO2-lipid IV(A) lauroyltransferase|nr:lysophospholipid acyltransferase family protein [Polyangiaceae bacterium]